MTEMPTLEPYDVTVEGTKLIQAMEDIDRQRDLLTIRTGGDPAARIDLAPLAEKEEEDGAGRRRRLERRGSTRRCWHWHQLSRRCSKGAEW